jgi:hypothetical protein
MIMVKEFDLEMNLIAAYQLLDERFAYDNLRLLRQRELATADPFEASERFLDLMLKDVVEGVITPIELKVSVSPQDILDVLYKREYIFCVEKTYPQLPIVGFMFISASPITDAVRREIAKAERTFASSRFPIYAITVSDFMEWVCDRFQEWNHDFQYLDRLEQDKMLNRLKRTHPLLFSDRFGKMIKPSEREKQFSQSDSDLSADWITISQSATVKDCDNNTYYIKVAKKGRKYGFIAIDQDGFALQGYEYPEFIFDLPTSAATSGMEQVKRFLNN